MKSTHPCSPEIFRVCIESRDDLRQDNAVREHVGFLIVRSSTQHLGCHPVGAADNGLLSMQVPRELKDNAYMQIHVA